MSQPIIDDSGDKSKIKNMHGFYLKMFETALAPDNDKHIKQFFM